MTTKTGYIIKNDDGITLGCFRNNQGSIITMTETALERAHELSPKSRAMLNNLDAGTYRARRTYHRGNFNVEITKRIDIDREIARVEKMTTTRGRGNGLSGSPGISGFAQRQDAANESARMRRQTTAKMLAWLKANRTQDNDANTNDEAKRDADRDIARIKSRRVARGTTSTLRHVEAMAKLYRSKSVASMTADELDDLSFDIERLADTLTTMQVELDQLANMKRDA